MKNLEMVIFDYCGQFSISYFLGWSYSSLHEKGVDFFWAEMPGQTQHDLNILKHENMKWSVFSWNGYFILTWTHLGKPDRHQTKICPGQKFVTKWISRYTDTYAYILQPNMCYSSVPADGPLSEIPRCRSDGPSIFCWGLGLFNPRRPAGRAQTAVAEWWCQRTLR